MDRHFRIARHWSNIQLQKYAPLFKGDIVNISANKDYDKEGAYYRQYFSNASNYSMTNYGGTRGESGNINEIHLDLEKPLDSDLYRRFDICFNHTTLEHIYHIHTAFSNICDMAKKAVILVIPWAQEVHTCDSFKDYWRISPYTVEKMFEENEFTMVVCNWNNEFNAAVYLFCIGIRNEALLDYPEFQKINLESCISIPGERIGEKKIKKLIKKLFSK